MYFWTTLCYDHRFCLLFSWGVLVILSEGLILEESAQKKNASWLLYGKTQLMLSCFTPHQCRTKVSLEICPLNSFIDYSLFVKQFLTSNN